MAGSSVRADTMGLGFMERAGFDTLSLMRFWADSWIVLRIDSSMLTGGEPNTMRRCTHAECCMSVTRLGDSG